MPHSQKIQRSITGEEERMPSKSIIALLEGKIIFGGNYSKTVKYKQVGLHLFLRGRTEGVLL